MKCRQRGQFTFMQVHDSATTAQCQCRLQQRRHRSSRHCVVGRCLDDAKRANRCRRTQYHDAGTSMHTLFVCMHVRACICKELSKPTASHVVAVNDASSTAMICSHLRGWAAKTGALSLVCCFELKPLICHICFAFSRNWYLLCLTYKYLYVFIYFSHFCRNFICFAFSSSLLCVSLAPVCRQHCNGYLCAVFVRKY